MPDGCALGICKSGQQQLPTGLVATLLGTNVFWGVFVMRVAVIGAGYVGLVSGTCLADFGHHVICVDNNTDRIAALRQGRIPIFEPGLEEMTAYNVRGRRLFFTADIAEAVRSAEVVFIAV